jgi:uncharacterized protein YacL
MTASIIGIIFGLAISAYCMVRSWQSFYKRDDSTESKVVSLVVSILFALLGTYLASCTWRELMEIWPK